jgi:hypothetical protein
MAQVKKKKKKQTEAQRLAHRDAVIAHADNKFVAELTEKMDAFIYTKDFYEIKERNWIYFGIHR